jgi:hypothetical protein
VAKKGMIMDKKGLKEFIINLLNDGEEAVGEFNVVTSSSFPEIADKIIEKIATCDPIDYKLLLTKHIAYMNDERDRFEQKVEYKFDGLDLNFTEEEIKELRKIAADIFASLPRA